MKIVFLSAYSGVINRGVESWLHEVASRLAIHNEVTVFQIGSPTRNQNYDTKVINIDIKWDKKGGKLQKLFLQDPWSKMIKEFTNACADDIIRINPDVIIPLNGGYEPIICKKLCHKLRAKMVCFSHFVDSTLFFYKPDLYISLTPFQQKIANLMF